jgi:hypothetical protein
MDRSGLALDIINLVKGAEGKIGRHDLRIAVSAALDELLTQDIIDIETLMYVVRLARHRLS